MNNKLFRILILFISVCVASVTTLLAVSFGLSNSGLSSRNNELTEEVKDLNNAVNDLQNTIDNLDEHAAIVTYQVGDSVWRIQIVQKNKEFNLPEYETDNEHVFNGWKLNGEGESLFVATINDDVKFVADIVARDWILTDLNLQYAPNWTDGTNQYYSYGSEQFKFNKITQTWDSVSWNGEFIPRNGNYVWSFNDEIYYSDSDDQYNDQYKLNQATQTWEPVVWNGEFVPGNGKYIWSTTTNCYYSNGEDQYKFNQATQTWEPITWTLPSDYSESISGECIWSYGTNYYHNPLMSYCYNSLILTGETTWEWSGMDTTSLYNSGSETASCIWSDGNNLYYTWHYYHYWAQFHCVLNQETLVWEMLPNVEYGLPDGLVGIPATTYVYGSSIWSDGTNIYWGTGSTYILNKNR